MSDPQFTTPATKRTWKRWTPQEDVILRVSVPGYSVVWLAELLDRTPRSVMHRAHSLGLRWQEHPARFWLQVLKTETCWLWIGAINPNGYGTYHLDGQAQGAHRVSYVMHKGTIPPGHDIHHICNTPLCVNPDHLAALTRADHLHAGNTFTAQKAAQTHCIHGHEFTAENTYVWRGTRKCRTCAKERKQRARAA
jgi:hypothetical protein